MIQAGLIYKDKQENYYRVKGHALAVETNSTVVLFVLLGTHKLYTCDEIAFAELYENSSDPRL